MADEAKKKAKAAEKAAKKQERSAKREKRNQTWKQVWQAFNMLRKKDKKLVPYMLIIWIGIALLMFAIGFLWGGQWWMLVLGIVLGFAVAMWFFSKRLENNMYDQVDDSPGAAGWALENMRNTMGIAGWSRTASPAPPKWTSCTGWWVTRASSSSARVTRTA